MCICAYTVVYLSACQEVRCVCVCVCVHISVCGRETDGCQLASGRENKLGL